ncbi:MAG TPA: hypothetical protein VG843_12035 [Rhizomicrobium sp.]|jgi:hypothetical protein|nr:hypothetical protein [Rhizomicrobium sp.]
MHHKRVLILGPTGTKKDELLPKIAGDLQRTSGEQVHKLHFEDFLDSSPLYLTFQKFLRQGHMTQAMIWDHAWTSLHKELGKIPENETVLLSMHGAYVRADQGTRSIANLNRICEEFRPTLVITVFDDVYQMWSRTEAEAQGDNTVIRPTLQELIAARRAEIMIGDMLVVQRPMTKCRHVIIALNHPVRFFSELILSNAQICYLSFPITAFREQSPEAKELAEKIRGVHGEAVASFNADGSARKIFISPLAIDELPLSVRYREWREANPELAKKPDDDTPVEFDVGALRFPVEEIWPKEELANMPVANSVLIPSNQLRLATGLIGTDVGWRDFKLVSQADVLAVSCPKPRHRAEMTRGVKNEILAALAMGGTPVYIWQPREFDPQGLVEKEFFSDPGSMGSDVWQTVAQKCDSMEQMLNRYVQRRAGQ